jgi:cysteine-rich repeat protein
MFSPPLDDASISSFVSSPALDDVTAPLQDRARSWLDANCAYCHRPGGVNAGFDARFTTPFVDQGFIGTPVRDDLGNPGTVVLYPGDAILSAIWQRSAAVGSIAMPPLAKELPEQPAVDLLAEWIERLPSAVPNNPPNLINPGDQNNRPGELVTLSLVASDQDGDVLYFDAAGLPPGLTLDHTTGEISGTLSASAADSHNVTVSVSDAIEVSAASFVWSVGEGGSIGTCGDGNLDAGEACDDGNRTSGDGCTTGCVLEVCGDGVVNNGGAEACEPPGTALCTNVCTLRTPRCGDGFLTPPEQCEDGNLVDGDGCGLDCTPEGGADLTYTGTIIARITNPVGGGSKDLEIIRDGDKPPVGNTSSSRQYDTYSGGAVATEDWIGYQYSTDQLFGQVVFQEGKNFVDGGYFLWLTVQVRQQGTWVEAPGVTITPAYAVNDGIHYNTYVLDFDPVVGDAIRIYGAPGGSKYFISVGELEVYSASASSLCGNGALDGGEECDDSNVVDSDGCSSTCAREFCGDGVVNNAGAEACEPPGTDVCTASCSIRTPTCGDGSVDLGEGCDDGNTIGGDGCSADCTFETRIDLTDSGAIIARITTPIGGGSKDPEVIRDDDKPPVGNTSSIRQYDTNSGGAVATEDWIGYEYATNQRFGQVVFQEGKNFEDGGYFLWVTVQVRQDGSWIEAPGVTITPAYAVNDGIHFNTYVLDFDPVVGDAIRIYGAPGGSKYFISIGELEVYSAPITGGCSVGNGTAPIDPVILLGVLGLALVRRRRRLRPASSPLAPFSHKVRVAERPSRH